ncbi:hypothetical protein K8I85_09400, partial [bacterium]|nr:hypothetical protein [bacterium]
EGGGAEVAVTQGQAMDGDVLPLPTYQDGTVADPANCAWVVTPGAVPTGYDALLGFDCWANADRVVTMRHYSYAGMQLDSWVNYIVIAARPDPGWEVAVKAEAQPHGAPITLPELSGEIAVAGALTGGRSFASGHDAMLGFGVRVASDNTQYVRQTTIDPGGPDFFDSLAITLTLAAGPVSPISVGVESWGRVKAKHR